MRESPGAKPTTPVILPILSRASEADTRARRDSRQRGSYWLNQAIQAVFLFKKILSAYEDAIIRADEEDGVIPRNLTLEASTNGKTNGAVAAVESAKIHAVEKAQRNGKAPVEPGYTIDSYTATELRSVVRWVKSDGLLRTEDELLNEVMEALWFERRGKKIVAAIADAIQAGAS
jgi:hypothetical protein